MPKAPIIIIINNKQTVKFDFCQEIGLGAQMDGRYTWLGAIFTKINWQIIG
jgi:hypothetical protein